MINKLALSLFILFIGFQAHTQTCAQLMEEKSNSKLALLEEVNTTIRGDMKNIKVLVSNEASTVETVNMIRAAKPNSTVQLGYFIFENDFSSSFIVREMLKRKAEGVKFEILVDYFMSEAFMPWMRYLTSQTHISVRRFRPPTQKLIDILEKDLQVNNPNRLLQGLMFFNKDMLVSELFSSPYVLKLIEKSQKLKSLINEYKEPNSQVDGSVILLTLFKEIEARDIAIARQLYVEFVDFTKRLHHKATIAETNEGVRVKAGGRNISDEYGLSLMGPGAHIVGQRNYPFFDADIVGTWGLQEGKSMQESLRKMFQDSNTTIRVEPFDLTKALDQKTYKEQEALMQEKAKEFESVYPKLTDLAEQGSFKLTTPDSKVLYIENTASSNRNAKSITDAWLGLLKAAEKEVVIVSAYFHFFPELINAVKEASDRGIKVKIYSNSFTSTDMNMVNVATYAKFNQWKSILGDNVSFFELNKGPKEGSLHAKMIFVDGKIIGVGSANTDPRSHLLDTNNLLVMNVESQSHMVEQIKNAYTGEGSTKLSLNLTWTELTTPYVNQLLERIRETSPNTLRATQLPAFINQL